MMEPCVATSVGGVVNLIVQLMTHGYFFYVEGNTRPGRSPRDLSPEEIDARIVRKFDANLPKWTRPRRRKLGQANVRYLRYGKDWFLFSTYGKHRFFEEHIARRPGAERSFKDIREESIRFHGYSIGLSRRGFEKKTPEEKAEHQARKLAQKRARDAGEEYAIIPRGRRHERWTGSVRIDRDRFLALRDEFLGIATHWSAERIAKRMYWVPFEPFAPVRQQMMSILREVNRARKHVGYDPVPFEAIRLRRKNIPAFAAPSESDEGVSPADAA